MIDEMELATQMALFRKAQTNKVEMLKSIESLDKKLTDSDELSKDVEIVLDAVREYISNLEAFAKSKCYELAKERTRRNVSKTSIFGKLSERRTERLIG